MQTDRLCDTYTLNTYARFPVEFVRGAGATLYDTEGKAYVDFTSGIGVSSLGYGNTAHAQAIAEQAQQLCHTSNLYYTPRVGEAAKLLCEKSGYAGVFFCNSGAEANEAAIKIARKYSFDRYGEGRNVIVTLTNSFHGRTVTTLAATGQDHFHQFFMPFTEGFRTVPVGHAPALKEALQSNDVCAVMLEPVQREGGVYPLDTRYLFEVEKMCRERDVLIIADEVQTGVGRTGTFLASHALPIEPQLVTLAKGLGGGLPIGAVLCSQQTKDVLGRGDHGSTFGGNPVCCAAACSVMEQLDESLLDEVKMKGEYMHCEIKTWRLPCMKAVRGAGLMRGIVLDGAVKARRVAELCLQKGLVILTAGNNTVRMLPPLVITMDEIDQGLRALRLALEEAAAESEQTEEKEK